MVFEVPASKASIKQNQFEFKIAGRKYSVKKVKYLSVGQAEALSAPESPSVVLDLFGEAGTAAGDAVRSLDQEQFKALVDAWQDDSAVSLGESPASES